MIQFKNHIESEFTDFEITDDNHLEDSQESDVDQISNEETFEDFFLAQSEEYGAIYDFAVVRLAGKLLKIIQEEEEEINKAIADEMDEEARLHYLDELNEYDNMDNN